MVKKLGLSPRIGSISILAAIAVSAVVGCSPSAPQATTQVYDPAVSKAASSNLLGLYDKLNKVYENDMTASDAKVDPLEKAIITKLQDPKADIKTVISQNHKLFADG